MSARSWRWARIADPNGPHPSQGGRIGPRGGRVAATIPSPHADRVGQPVRELVRGRNGNALLEFEDGLRVIAPWRAAL